MFDIDLYFSRLPIISSVIFPLFSTLILYALFRKVKSARVRCWSLGMMFLSSLLLWVIIATSLILCFTFLGTDPFEIGIRQFSGSAILIAMAAAIPLSLALRVISPRIMIGSVKGLHPVPRDLKNFSIALAGLMRIATPKLRLFKSSVPISFAVEADGSTVVMSERLLSLLTAEEIEAVIAHEFAHIKNSDTKLKALLKAYTTLVPLDPIMPMIEAAFHREREILADEVAARVTGNPTYLASALLKIHRISPKNAFSSRGAPSILGFGPALTNRHPSMSNRINHLIRLQQVNSIKSLTLT